MLNLQDCIVQRRQMPLAFIWRAPMFLREGWQLKVACSRDDLSSLDSEPSEPGEKSIAGRRTESEDTIASLGKHGTQYLRSFALPLNLQAILVYNLDWKGGFCSPASCAHFWCVDKLSAAWTMPVLADLHITCFGSLWLTWPLIHSSVYSKHESRRHCAGAEKHKKESEPIDKGHSKPAEFKRTYSFRMVSNVSSETWQSLQSWQHNFKRATSEVHNSQCRLSLAHE